MVVLLGGVQLVAVGVAFEEVGGVEVLCAGAHREGECEDGAGVAQNGVHVVLML